MKRKERLKEAYEYLKSIGEVHTQKELAQKMNTTPPNVSSAMKGEPRVLTDSFLERLNNAFDNLFNIDWLINGGGEMLANNENSEDVYDITKKPELTENVIMIPVFNLDARGGFLSNDEVGTPEYITKYEPFSREVAREGDLVIPIFGDSMEPKYPSGTMVLIRKIELWQEYIEYGASYVLELIDERRLIKNVQKGKSRDTLLLVSINEKFEPAEIAKNLIRNVFRVLMSVRREAM